MEGGAVFQSQHHRLRPVHFPAGASSTSESSIPSALNQPLSAVFAPQRLDQTVWILFHETVTSFVLRGELFDMWYVALAVVASLLVAVLLANTDLFLTKSSPASLEELGAADLQTTTGDGKTVKGLTLWERHGAVILAVRRPG